MKKILGITFLMTLLLMSTSALNDVVTNREETIGSETIHTYLIHCEQTDESLVITDRWVHPFIIDCAEYNEIVQFKYSSFVIPRLDYRYTALNLSESLSP